MSAAKRTRPQRRRKWDTPARGLRKLTREGCWLGSLHARRAQATAMTISAGALALTLLPASSAAAAAVRDPFPHPERKDTGPAGPAHTRYAPDPLPATAGSPAADGPHQPGIDVSRYQGEINWQAVESDGIEFAYIRATKGTTYTDPRFRHNYTRAARVGMFRGAYHFALPDTSSGAAQAQFFLAHGGNGSPDGLTLPPVLDIEYNRSGPDCYGLTHRQMINWIADFSATVNKVAGRHPVIYTTTDWWNRCTGGYGGFADTNPLWIANWSNNPYPLPNGWGRYTFWQHTAKGRVAGIDGHVDRDKFNGSYAQLQALAT